MHVEHAAQIDDLEHIQAQIAKFVVNCRVERLADDLIGDVRAVEVRGIDVVHAIRDGRAQHGQRCIAILGWAEYAGSRELHGAVAETPDIAVAEFEAPGLIDAGHARDCSWLQVFV